MIDAISTLSQSMHRDQMQLQSIAHNISNIHTPGYQRERMDFITTPGSMADIMTQTVIIPEQGAISHTQRPLDIALSGSGYFEIQTDTGKAYTRRGDFHIDHHGYLVTAQGAQVLVHGTPVFIENDAVRILKNGDIMRGQEKIAQLACVQFDHPEMLHPDSSGLYTTEENPQPADATTFFIQGALEQSNTDHTDLMLSMIETARHFESGQRILRTTDALMQNAIRQIGV